jgi:MFS family permease
MFTWPRLASIGTSRRDFFIVFTLLFNAFTWFYMIMIMGGGILDSAATMQLIFYIATIGSGIAGSMFSERIRRLDILYVWMGLGTISSFLLTSFWIMAIPYVSVVYVLLGISFGIGMPSSLAFLADYTRVENRGRISSLIFFAVNLGALPLAILFTEFNLITNSIILTVWRGLGLLVFILLKPQEKKTVETDLKVSFSSILNNRSMILYLLPWIMFSLIDSLEKALLGDFVGPNFLHTILTVEPVIASLFILIGGFLADRIGRKRVVTSGFVLLGIAYASVGLAPTMQLAWYFYIAMDGIATGALWIIFLLIIWGDLSESGVREKYYAIGCVPYLARNIISVMLVPFFAKVQASAAFSLASFFLFLAVLPLMYAPETLSQKKIELRQLKGYIEQAKKAREKHTGKSVIEG